MQGIIFDTLAYNRTLQSAGLPPEQADALTQAQKAVLAEAFSAWDLAKQSDIVRLEARGEVIKNELQAEIAATKHELDAKIEAVKNELEAKIETTRHALDAKIETTKNELQAQIAAVKHDLLKWIIGLAFAQMALTTTLLTFFR